MKLNFVNIISAETIALGIIGCQNEEKKNVVNQKSLSEYFNYSEQVEAGGVKLIPIETPVGTFKVWTRIDWTVGLL